MTPRNPWRRTWRDEIVPLLWWSAFIAFMFVIVNASIARADAAPASAGEQFAHDHAADICMMLDQHPTVGGIIDALDDIQANGLTHRESAIALMESVVYVCPIHTDLLQRLMDRTQPAPAPGRELVA